MIELYSFAVAKTDGAFDDVMDNLVLIDDRMYALFYKGYSTNVEIGSISQLVNSFFISKPLVMQVVKGFNSNNNVQVNKVDSLIVTFENNSVLLLDPETGGTKSTIYPPPTPSLVSKVIFSMCLKRIFILLQNGNICVYRVHKRDTASLEKLQSANDLKDYEGRGLFGSTIKTMDLVTIKPPKFDSEIHTTNTKGFLNLQKGKIPVIKKFK